MTARSVSHFATLLLLIPTIERPLALLPADWLARILALGLTAYGVHLLLIALIKGLVLGPLALAASNGLRVALLRGYLRDSVRS